jgi:hypothetical protein
MRYSGWCQNDFSVQGYVSPRPSAAVSETPASSISQTTMASCEVSQARWMACSQKGVRLPKVECKLAHASLWEYS